jgi:hypothetical protein
MKNTITIPDAIDFETFLANASEEWEKHHESPRRKKPVMNNSVLPCESRIRNYSQIARNFKEVLSRMKL